MKAQIIDKGNFRVVEKLVDSDKVVFVFTAMGMKLGAYRLFMRLMNKKGYTVVAYDYPIQIIHDANFDEWKDLYDGVIHDAQARLSRLKKNGVTKHYSLGTSMGTLVAHKFARDTPDISHVVLILTYGDLATHIWISSATRKAKANLMRRGVSLEEVRSKVKELDPVANAKALKGKKVLLQLSRPDKILKYKESIATKHALEAAGAHVTYKESKYLGHFAYGASQTLNSRQLDEFFNS